MSGARFPAQCRDGSRSAQKASKYLPSLSPALVRRLILYVNIISFTAELSSQFSRKFQENGRIFRTSVQNFSFGPTNSSIISGYLLASGAEAVKLPR